MIVLGFWYAVMQGFWQIRPIKRAWSLQPHLVN